MTMPRFALQPPPTQPGRPKKSVLVQTGSNISEGSTISTRSSGGNPAAVAAAAVGAVKDAKAEASIAKPKSLIKSRSFDQASVASRVSFKNDSSLVDEAPSVQQPTKQQTLPGGFPIPPGMVPMTMKSAAGGKDSMPQLVYMMPCGSACYGNDGHSRCTDGYSCGGDTTLNTTYESMDSFDSTCQKPLESVGKMVRRATRLFLRGVNGTLDYGEKLCSPGNPAKGGDPAGAMGTSSQNPSEMQDKVDELLKLLKEKESPAKDGETQKAGDDISKQATELMQMVKDTAGSVKDNLAVLNESAITHASEMLGLGTDPPAELVVDPTVAEVNSIVVADEEAETPKAKSKSNKPKTLKDGALVDELAYEFNSKGLSISGEAGKTDDENKENIGDSAKAKKPRRGFMKQMLKDITGSTKNVKKTQTKKANFADFTSNTAVDSMGFPSTSAQPAQDDKPVSWQADFDTTNAFKDINSIEAKVCAWCKKGGKTNPDLVEKLKLCSRCQATYYCSPECQSKDWAKGHATSCQPHPTSVAMY